MKVMPIKILTEAIFGFTAGLEELILFHGGLFITPRVYLQIYTGCFLKKGGGLIPHSSIWIRLRVTDVDKQNCRNQLGWVVGWNVVVTPCMVGCIELSGDRFVGEADVSAGEFLENG